MPLIKFPVVYYVLFITSSNSLFTTTINDSILSNINYLYDVNILINKSIITFTLQIIRIKMYYVTGTFLIKIFPFYTSQVENH